MKQMTLIEMDGFLKGKCIPCDLKVNETNAEYIVRKFAELESKLETALRECRSAGITIDNLEARCAALATDNEKAMEAMRQADAAVKLAHEKFSALAAENSDLKSSRAILAENTLEACNAIASAGFTHEAIMRGFYASTGNGNKYPKPITTLVDEALSDFQAPATDAFLAEVRAQGVDMARNAMIDFVDGEVGPNKNVPGLIRGAEICASIAEQLRKGGDQ